MARPLRSQFAAPLVIVIAGSSACSGGGTKEPGGSRERAAAWTVRREGDRCTSMRELDCPPDVACNPPPPQAIVCAPDYAQGVTRLVEVKPGRCAIRDGNLLLPCPQALPPQPPIDAAAIVDAPATTPTIDAGAVAVAADAGAVASGRVWQVLRRGKTCTAFHDTCSGRGTPGQPALPCNPPPPVAIACPPTTDITGILEVKPGECIAMFELQCPPNVPCNPPAPQPIPCPKR